MKISKTILLSVALAFAAAAGAASAEGDAAKGQQTATGCAGCHGPAGEGMATNPPIAGLDAAYMVEQLKKFKSGERANPMMKMATQALSEDDMANIAAFYASKAAK